MIPQGLKYTKEHEWISVQGAIGTVGITAHAQKELGDITFIELPEKGKTVSAGNSIATIESVKAASDIYAPVSGKITDVNTILSDSPETINSAPYGEGWICKIEMKDPVQLKGLMDAAAYGDYLKTL
ncbi:MAG: glycine cleavage system protein GcvH [Candidatus Omnitrophica bacterium]|nr:glycine cleavage system protein GcvH [Candidatus Omnitrophota bacterium]